VPSTCKTLDTSATGVGAVFTLLPKPAY
jgi:hypothetical protein